MSRFRDDSELNQLNRQAGQPVVVSEILWDVLQSALWAHTFSQGLVTPAVLDAMLNIGYDRSFDTLPEQTGGQGGHRDNPYSGRRDDHSGRNPDGPADPHGHPAGRYAP